MLEGAPFSLLPFLVQRFLTLSSACRQPGLCHRRHRQHRQQGALTEPFFPHIPLPTFSLPRPAVSPFPTLRADLRLHLRSTSSSTAARTTSPSSPLLALPRRVTPAGFKFRMFRSFSLHLASPAHSDVSRSQSDISTTFEDPLAKAVRRRLCVQSSSPPPSFFADLSSTSSRLQGVSHGVPVVVRLIPLLFPLHQAHPSHRDSTRLKSPDQTSASSPSPKKSSRRARWTSYTLCRTSE